MSQKTLILIIAILSLLSGCSTLQNQSANTPLTEEPQPSLPDRDLEPDILYQLLVAELAGQQQRYDILLGNYLAAAQKTGDAGLAERATHIAVSLKAHQAALTAAQLWHQAAPHNSRAKQVLAGQLILNENLDEAIELLEQLLASDNDTSFDTFTINSQALTEPQREQLIQQLNRLLAIYPNTPQLLFSQTLLLRANEHLEEALSNAEQLHQLQPTPRNLSLLAKLKQQLGDTKEALKVLKKGLKTYPDSRPLQVLYGQLLIDNKQLVEAQRQFAELYDQYPHDEQVKLTLALLSLENGNTQQGEQLLQELTQSSRLANEALYHLGQSAQRQSQPQKAIDFYRQINGGARLLPAYHQLGTLLLEQDQLAELHSLFHDARVSNKKESHRLTIIEAELIAEQGHTDQAFTLLNEALESSPKNINLLYTRAMLAERTNDLQAMEKDLRFILNIEPDNAMALNALGYTLADRTTRYQEALTLITRAKELQPNDPAVIDSLGWVHFRLGDYKLAVELLEEALAAFPDHEVAAHLGEALWFSGDQQRARQVWQKALEETPDSPILKRVIERLSPDLNATTTP